MISTWLRLASLDAGGRVGVATRATVLVRGAEQPFVNEDFKEAMFSVATSSTARADTSPTVPDQSVTQTQQAPPLRNETDVQMSF